VIFLTAKVNRHDEGDLAGLGAAGIVAKPFNPLTLPSQVREILARL
jgi:DNA-binding response OmpR family regulator